MRNRTPRKTFQNLAEEKQVRITRAAAEEFSEKGYAGASINNLVRRLGIAKGSIFQYFGDKESLFKFVFDQAIEQVKEYLRTTRDQTSDEKIFVRLEKTLLAGVRFIRQHPVIYRLYIKILNEPQNPFREDLLLSLRKYSHEFLADLLVTALERGEVRPDLNPDQAAFMLDAVMDRFLQAQASPYLDAGLGLFQCDEDTARQWAGQLIAFLESGLGAPSDRNLQGKKTGGYPATS